ncbi:3-hydroxyacyl-ACP dehydratase [Avrilella dinanensis]|uniref:3-hydroxyacyl-ACP dehydratase n=1 Tax=Avrilella dinanensis TaxID=2008672 RepID=A0A2M9R7K9_9FLAO|nr:3-hydroxyacyl-ACP dehydratase [Avrilella dinanensis]PJR04834.1 3-hydroxyacyl-ACP dehydratase [Avrilella dinanensis]
MLLQDFYKVNSLEKVSDQSYQVDLTLNARHEVFKGHFPGNPVTPGVGMMQIIKELTEEITGKKLFLTNASNVKFMALINPEVTPDLKLELDMTLTDNEVKVKNITSFGETTALKLTNTYKIV